MTGSGQGRAVHSTWNYSHRWITDNCLNRRAKAALLTEDLPALERLVKKGKKVTPEVITDRASKVWLKRALQASRSAAACSFAAVQTSLMQTCKHARTSTVRELFSVLH